MEAQEIFCLSFLCGVTMLVLIHYFVGERYEFPALGLMERHIRVEGSLKLCALKNTEAGGLEAWISS